MFYTLLILLSFPLFLLQGETILVSIPPYRQIVQQIAGDEYEVEVIVPPGTSPHFFEPSARQVVRASKSAIWFRIGEGFEEKILPPLTQANRNLTIVDLRKDLPLIRTHDHGHSACSHAGCFDPHTWTSPEMVKKQVETIVNALSLKFPNNAFQFTSNGKLVLLHLNKLDRDIRAILKDVENKTIVISHPAFAYFCRTYGLEQLGIEFEGKEPSPKQVARLIQQLKVLSPKQIFIVANHPSKGSQLIAEMLSTPTTEVNPLSEHYFEMLFQFAEHIRGSK